MWLPVRLSVRRGQCSINTPNPLFTTLHNILPERSTYYTSRLCRRRLSPLALQQVSPHRPSSPPAVFIPTIIHDHPPARHNPHHPQPPCTTHRNGDFSPRSLPQHKRTPPHSLGSHRSTKLISSYVGFDIALSSRVPPSKSSSASSLGHLISRREPSI